MRNLGRLTLGMCLVLLVSFAWAKPVCAAEKENKRNVFAGSPLFWSVPKIMDVWVAALTRYYDLDEQQEEFTRALMNQRVKEFLIEHERDVRTLFSEYLGYRMSQEMPDQEVAMEFAGRAAPLMSAIRKEILDGNMDWREILNDEQKKKHDRDLQQMTRFFDQFDGTLERWSNGDVRPADFGRISRSPRRIRKMEDGWDIYVKHFIRSYRLDEGQQQTAYSILRELKQAAARYRDSHKEEFAELDTRLQSLSGRTPKTNPADLEQYKKQYSSIRDHRQRLERPISSLYEQLRSRLDGIPTSDQRREFNLRIARTNRPRGAMAKRPSSQPVGSETRPADGEVELVGAESQPEAPSTQPVDVKQGEVAAKP